MKPSSPILRFIYRHERLASIYEWLGEHWLMVVIYVLFALVVLCMINLTVLARNVGRKRFSVNISPTRQGRVTPLPTARRCA